jgi:lipopolysaccharide export system protein LptA
MQHNLRKFRVALIAVLSVLAVFLLYNSLFKTPKIEMDYGPGPAVGDVNQARLSQEAAPVGPVSLGTLDMARFSTINPKTKQLEREFGFERLLHEQGDQWELEKPYMNIYRPDLVCYITADTGYVVLESDVSPPNPTDATLTGNVVAHIVPTPGSDVAESFIYLNDLTFISSKSRFSTAGPVTFVSENAQMQGKGLEMIYDDQKKRLALLRIEQVEHLQFKVQKGYSLAQAGSQPDKTIDGGSTRSQDKTNLESYRCVFSGNVVIDSGQQFIVADLVSISDIIWNGGKSDRQQQSETVTTDSSQTAQPQEQTQTQDLLDVAVSCDNGIAVVPTNALDTLKKIPHFLDTTGGESPVEAVEDEPGRTTFAAEEIDYSLATSDAVAPGYSKLTFYVKDVMDQSDESSALPLVVTSKKMAKFSPKSNRITFEGDCLCRMLRSDLDVTQEYVLSAPKLIVDLNDEQVSNGRALADVARITALSEEGAGSRLSSVKRDGDKFLGGIELKCPRFEYDAQQQMFIASGPGVVKADNSRIPQPSKDVGRFSMQKPCYAIVRNFEQLRYYLQTERIVADNTSERIYIDYFPITDKKPEQVTMTAGRIEADLVETPTGQYRLWTLYAADGISFQDRDKIFEGSELLYDDQRDVVWARGSDAMPAYFNGIMFDGIEYDLATDEVRKVEIKGPGFFNISQ